MALQGGGDPVVSEPNRTALTNKFRQCLRDLRTGDFTAVPFSLGEAELQDLIIVLEEPRLWP